MPTLNVADVTRIATVAARQVSPELEVLGLTINSGGSDYVEVLLDLRGCRAGRCQLLLGAFRNVSESHLQSELAGQMRRHLAEHAADAAPADGN